MEPTHVMDDFWLYDFPINPINIPSILIINKPKENSKDVLDTILKRIGRNHRCSVKMVKILGKYYFKKLNDEEY
jgi:hypothetical protein